MSGTFAQVKVGDRILYHGRGSPTHIYIGNRGTVLEVRNNVTAKVVFDGETTPKQVSTANIELLFNGLTVENAIALLKQHGTVTFVPAFKPISMNLNDEYEAVIKQDHVKVGCQTFCFERVLTLAEMVKKVQAEQK